MSNSASPQTIACQIPLPMEFSRQEYWSGLPLSSPGHIADPRIEPRSPALWADSLLSEPPGKFSVINSDFFFFNVLTTLIFVAKTIYPGSSLTSWKQSRRTI